MNTHDDQVPAGQTEGSRSDTVPPPLPEPPNGTPGSDVDGAVILDDLETALRRYVSLPSDAAVVGVVLWIAATHAQPAWAHAPRLVVRAPEKRCGKSRLLDVVEGACHDPFITVNATPAAVYRSITADPPTMLVDEADTIFGPKADGHEDLRGLLNAGHQRNRPAKRYDLAKNRVESISTFAMAALAGIGRMPDTIEDRAVVVQMRRRAPGETVEPYRHRRDRPRLQRLAERLNGWLRNDLTTLETAEPAMPVEDRAADTWEPLIAIADHAGGHWPEPRATPRHPRPPSRRHRRRPLRTHPPPRRLPHRLRQRTRTTHHAAPPATPRRPGGTVGRVRATRGRTHRHAPRQAPERAQHPVHADAAPWIGTRQVLRAGRVRRHLAALYTRSGYRQCWRCRRSDRASVIAGQPTFRVLASTFERAAR